MPLITGEEPLALWSVILLTAAFSIWAGNTRLGGHISGIGIAIFAAIFLSNAGIIPRTGPIYDTIFNYLLPVSIPLLLFEANLKKIIRETGTMLLAFLIGAVGIVLGVLVGVTIIPLGENSAGLAGVFAATYIGGSMNFGAVSQASGFQNSSLLSTAIAADTLATNFYIITVMALPSILLIRRWIPSRIIDDTQQARRDDQTDAPAAFARPPLRLSHICLALGLATAIAAAGHWLEEYFEMAGYAIIFITILALIPGNAFPERMAQLQGTQQTGLFLIYLFLIAIGAGADVRAMFGSALPITAFSLVVLIVHLAFLLPVGRLFRLDLAELIIASNANVGGSTSAGPIAAARGWNKLVTPAILCGVLGNAIGTFIGIALFNLLS